MAAEDEATSKKVVLKKEYGSAKTTKPGLNRKVPAKRTPMLKVRGSTQVPEKPDPKEPAAEGKGQKDHGQSCWTTFHDGRGRRGCCTSTQGTKADG